MICKASSVRNLPLFCQRVLQFYYELRLQHVDRSNYSLQELAQRFGRRPDYISYVLSFLEKLGFLASIKHGSAYKKRWITYEAFNELDTQFTNQNTNQNISTPNIDLFHDKDVDLNLIEDAQNCGQTSDLTPDQQLQLILITQNLSNKQIQRIQKDFRTSPIGEQRKKSIIANTFKQIVKQKINNLGAYFSAAIQNEYKKVKNLRELLKLPPLLSEA